MLTEAGEVFMAGKKRKKSNTERINYEKRRQQRLEKEAKKKRIILISVLSALAAIIIAGLVIGGIAIAKHVKRQDYCIYLESRNITGHDIAYATITVKGYGDIEILLDASTAPKTVNNFINLAELGKYNGTTFHRVVDNFMIQGGKTDTAGTLKGEFSQNGHTNDISHKRGVISMARATGYDTASSQFFICNADATQLDGAYAAFGYVIKGLKIVDEITKDTLQYTDGADTNKESGLEGGTIRDTSKMAVIEKITITQKPKNDGHGTENETEPDLVSMLPTEKLEVVFTRKDEEIAA